MVWILAWMRRLEIWSPLSITWPSAHGHIALRVGINGPDPPRPISTVNHQSSGLQPIFHLALLPHSISLAYAGMVTQPLAAAVPQAHIHAHYPLPSQARTRATDTSGRSAPNRPQSPCAPSSTAAVRKGTEKATTPGDSPADDEVAVTLILSTDQAPARNQQRLHPLLSPLRCALIGPRKWWWLTRCDERDGSGARIYMYDVEISNRMRANHQEMITAEDLPAISRGLFVRRWNSACPTEKWIREGEEVPDIQAPHVSATATRSHTAVEQPSAWAWCERCRGGPTSQTQCAEEGENWMGHAVGKLGKMGRGRRDLAHAGLFFVFLFYFQFLLNFQISIPNSNLFKFELQLFKCQN
jgi:hypothetical protein